jgi:sugar phosphate permease
MDSGHDVRIAATSHAPQPATPRVRRMQITALTLLVTSGAVNYVDRATLAIGNPLIPADLHLSVADLGLLLSAFLWAYAFAQLPAGGLVDRFGPRRLLGAGILLWSIAQGLTGLCANFSQFVFALSWAWARRRNSPRAPAWCGTGSTCAAAGLRPACSIAPLPLGPRSPRHCSPSSC